MEREVIIRKIIKIIAELLPNQLSESDLIQYADLIDDLGMDSITFISILVKIESCFEIIITDDLLILENFRCVDNIATIVENELINKEVEGYVKA